MFNVIPATLRNKKGKFVESIKTGHIVKASKWFPTHKLFDLPQQAMPESYIKAILPKLSAIIDIEQSCPSDNGTIATHTINDQAIGTYKWIDPKSNPRSGILGFEFPTGNRIEITNTDIIALVNNVDPTKCAIYKTPLPVDLKVKLDSIFQRTPNKFKGSKVNKEVSTGALETEFKSKGIKLIVGIDESGRGSIAGPFVAAAVLIDLDQPLPEIFSRVKDSKSIDDPAELKQLSDTIEATTKCGIGVVSAQELNELNDLDASNQLAFERAIVDLQTKHNVKPDHILLDGTSIKLANDSIPYSNHPQGESISTSIGAASILAKSHHDELMHELHFKYPAYQFNRHKGGTTVTHKEMLTQFGPCPEHRIHFDPVRKEMIRRGIPFPKVKSKKTPQLELFL